MLCEALLNPIRRILVQSMLLLRRLIRIVRSRRMAFFTIQEMVHAFDGDRRLKGSQDELAD